MKIITLFTLLFLGAHLVGSTQRNVNIGFLKPNARNITIKDTNAFNQPTGILSTKSNFEIEPAGAGKFKISTSCAVARDTDKTMFCVNGEAYVDTSLIIQFDLLPQMEKKKRIEKGFSDYVKAVKQKPFNYTLITVTHEGIYSPIRTEFAKYWLAYKDDELLAEWFNLLYYDAGSADEIQSLLVARLFCEGTDDFTRVFSNQSKKLKAYIFDRLEEPAFMYYATRYFPNDGQTDNRVAEFIQLCNAKLKPLL